VADVEKTCAKCGHEQESGDFCQSCGTPLPVAGTPATAVGPSTPPPAGSQAGYSGGRGFWSRFFDFSFQEFITPSLIKVLFILAMIVIGLGVLGAIIFGFMVSAGTGVFALIAALIYGFVMLLFARVGLEMIIVFFRIHEDTKEIARSKRR
jgi:Domain of unknown function (DUF4282)